MARGGLNRLKFGRCWGESLIEHESRGQKSEGGKQRAEGRGRRSEIRRRRAESEQLWRM